MSTPDTPEGVVQSLARHLDGAANSKPNLKKILLAHLDFLEPLRATADDAILESFYTVAAWYLTPPYLLKQPSVEKDLDHITGSRRITAIITLGDVWGSKAVAIVCHLRSNHGPALTVSQIRQSLRKQLPLPTIPGRDFLETLAKIATKRYSLNAFLKDLPSFIESKLHTCWTEDPKYFRQEQQPCLQFRHVDAFYKDVYVPNFLQNGKAIEESIHAVDHNKASFRLRRGHENRQKPSSGPNSSLRSEPDQEQGCQPVVRWGSSNKPAAAASMSSNCPVPSSGILSRETCMRD